MTIRILSERDTLKGFRYFWGKHVTGFNPNVHCARCLKGTFDKNVGLSMPMNQDIDVPLSDGEVFYICGVATPYKWDNNGHLAVKGKIGATAQLHLYNGDTVEVKDAEQIPFDDKVALSLYGDKTKEFTTCRNFQFGASYFMAGKGK